MKKFIAFFSIITSLLLCLSLASCGVKGDRFDLNAFGSPVHVEVYEKKLTKEVKNKISTLLSALDKEFSLDESNSFTVSFNNAQKNQGVLLSNTAKSVLQACKDYYTFSSTLFNPTILPLKKLWKFSFDTKVDNTHFTPPTMEQINEVLNSGVLDFDKVNIDNDEAYKTVDGLTLDFGGMLKGYACDEVAKILLNAGYDSGYVNLGSSSMRILSSSKLSVRHPENSTSTILEINCENIKNFAVSTSGDYEKFYTFEGERYSHIINPLTGAPYQTNLHSVTVLGKDGAFLDAISTTLCLLDFSVQMKNDNPLVYMMNKIVEKDDSVMIFAVYSDGQDKFLITNKMENTHFTLLDSTYEVFTIS